MEDQGKEPLGGISDLQLAAFIAEEQPDRRDELLVEMLHKRADPVIRDVLNRLRLRDAEDLRETVVLRLLQRLRRLPTGGVDESIRSFDEYVASTTYNCAYDFLRSRYPARTRLKNRLRYVLTHDRRFAMWEGKQTMLCGLATWRDEPRCITPAISRPQATPAMLDAGHPAAGLDAIFRRAGGAIEVDVLVDVVCELWGIVESTEHSIEDEVGELADARTDILRDLEWRDALRYLWSEIVQLRRPQRVALLLHLRDEQGSSTLPLFSLTGIASLDEITKALDISDEELALFWNDLPLEDLRIAGILGLTRQQIINLRQSARARLTRRMRSKSISAGNKEP